MSSKDTKDILNFPSKWPASFPTSNVRTRVLTYVFKNDSKVETFLNFIKNRLPTALVSVFKDTNGYTNVTITQTFGGTATADKTPCTIIGGYINSVGLCVTYFVSK